MPEEVTERLNPWQEQMRIQAESEARRAKLEAEAKPGWQTLETQVQAFLTKAEQKYGDRLGLGSPIRKNAIAWYGFWTRADAVRTMDITVDKKGQKEELTLIEVSGVVGDKTGDWLLAGDGSVFGAEFRRWESDDGRQMCNVEIKPHSEPDAAGRTTPLVAEMSDRNIDYFIVNYDQGVKAKGIYGLGNEYLLPNGERVVIQSNWYDALDAKNIGKQNQRMEYSLNKPIAAAPTQPGSQS